MKFFESLKLPLRLHSSIPYTCLSVNPYDTTDELGDGAGTDASGINSDDVVVVTVCDN